VEDPARPPDFGVYPLKRLVPNIDALRYFRVVPSPDPVLNQAGG
jgi:hypothetical protein